MAKSKPKYPNITITLDLTGPQGNAYAVMGAVQSGLERAGVSRKEIDQYIAESTSGDYDNLLAVAGRWVNFVSVRHAATVVVD